MNRAAVLMAILCIGVASYALVSVLSQGWSIVTEAGLLGPPSSQVLVHRVDPGSPIFSRSRLHAS